MDGVDEERTCRYEREDSETEELHPDKLQEMMTTGRDKVLVGDERKL
jgi:hypothetical protein